MHGTTVKKRYILFIFSTCVVALFLHIVHTRVHTVHTRVFITPEEVSDKVTGINDVISTEANYRAAASPTLAHVIVNIWISVWTRELKSVKRR